MTQLCRMVCVNYIYMRKVLAEQINKKKSLFWLQTTLGAKLVITASTSWKRRGKCRMGTEFPYLKNVTACFVGGPLQQPCCTFQCGYLIVFLSYYCFNVPGT